MTYATATTDICTAHNDLSAIIDRYDTRNNLCSTVMATWEACSNLSTAADLEIFNRIEYSGNHNSLSSTDEYPLRPCNSRSDYYRACRNIHRSSRRLIPSLFDPVLTFGRLSQSLLRPCNSLGSAITNPDIIIGRAQDNYLWFFQEKTIPPPSAAVFHGCVN